MSDWYYAHNGAQKGPIPISELQRLADTGEFNPEKDLVWQDGMPEWKVASAVPELVALAPARQSAPTEADSQLDYAQPRDTGSDNPYSAPRVADVIASPVSSQLDQEIPPGSEPLDISRCIGRSFELTKRHFGLLVGAGLVYFLITTGLSYLTGMIEGTVSGGPNSFIESWQTIFSGFSTDSQPVDVPPPATPASIMVSIVAWLLNTFVTTFLSLGATRLGLNIVSNQHASISMLFGESQKTIRGVVAGILYGLMVGLGIILLIVPGIYLALRFGQYQNAIVDKDMGVFDSFGYSSRITDGNKMSLLGLFILCFLIVLAGILILLVGLIFAYPIIWLASFVAYRWLQYGSASTQDPA